MKNNPNKILYIIITIISIIALALLGYIIYDKMFNSEEKTIGDSNNEYQDTSANVDSNDNETIQSNTGTTTCKDFEIDAKELAKIGKSDYNTIKDVYNSEYSFKLDVNGKININFENNISNISNAKDIILFSPAGPNSYLYILTKDGDVYKYDTSGYKQGNYSADKVSNYSNIKAIIEYTTAGSNKGGCGYIVLVDNNEKYYKLDSYCV